MTKALSHLEILWDAGQRQLSRGRYIAARRDLESAEALAWQHQDAATLARLYLPLLEVRRQIRQNAVEGTILITDRVMLTHTTKILNEFSNDGGTLIIAGAAPHIAYKLVNQIRARAIVTGAPLEALVLLQNKSQLLLASPAAATFGEALPIRTARDEKDVIDPDAVLQNAASAPLPAAGIYRPPNPLQALARETLLIMWEALALHWQSRHPLSAAGPSPAAAWQEIFWLRKTLEIDPACEPAAMRLMSVAESIDRSPHVSEDGAKNQ